MHSHAVEASRLCAPGGALLMWVIAVMLIVAAMCVLSPLVLVSVIARLERIEQLLTNRKERKL